MPDDNALDAVERWFRSRGIPRFIGHDSARGDVFTPALPARREFLDNVRAEVGQAFAVRAVYLAARGGTGG